MTADTTADMAADTDADTKKIWTADTDADTDIEKLLSADTDADTDMQKFTYRGHVRGRGQVADTRVRRALSSIMVLYRQKPTWHEVQVSIT